MFHLKMDGRLSMDSDGTWKQGTTSDLERKKLKFRLAGPELRKLKNSLQENKDGSESFQMGDSVMVVNSIRLAKIVSMKRSQKENGDSMLEINAGTMDPKAKPTQSSVTRSFGSAADKTYSPPSAQIVSVHLHATQESTGLFSLKVDPSSEENAKILFEPQYSFVKNKSEVRTFIGISSGEHSGFHCHT